VGWIERLEPTQTVYSYVMNNYWETNYKASQDGPTLFRYSLRPHAAYDAAGTARFGIERSQPLIVVPARAEPLPSTSSVRVESDAVIATSVRPASATGALIVRLYNPTDQAASASIRYSETRSTRTELCDLTGFPLGELAQPIQLEPYQFVTVQVSN
jgi:alpha-mannosidase